MLDDKTDVVELSVTLTSYLQNKHYEDAYECCQNIMMALFRNEMRKRIKIESMLKEALKDDLS